MTDRSPFEDATDRGIVQLVLQGKSNKHISAALGIPISTVKWRLHRLYDHLGVESRSALIVKVRDRSSTTLEGDS